MLNRKKYLIFIILLTALFVRVHKIDFQSYWADELYSAFVSQPSHTIDEIIYYQKKDAHPPLYQFSLWIIYKIFGFNEKTGRLFSAISGWLALIFFYLFFKDFFDEKTAVFGLTISSFLYFFVYYSQENRSYSLLLLFTMTTFYFFIKLYRKPTNYSLFFYSFFAILLIYTHYFGFLILGAQGLTSIVYWLKNRKQNKSFFIKMILAGIICLVFYLPWINFLIHNRMLNSTWISKPNYDFFIKYLKVYAGKSYGFLKIFFIFTFILAFLKQFRNQKENNEKSNGFSHDERLILILIWLFFSYFIPFVVSVVRIPVLIPRVTIIGVPALICVFSYPVFFLKEKIVYFLSLLLFLGMTFKLSQEKIFHSVVKENWRGTLKYIEQMDKKGEIPVYSHYWQSLSAYAKMLKLNKKITNPTITKFRNKIMDSKPLSKIFVIRVHRLNYGVRPEVQKLIDNFCKKISSKKFKGARVDEYLITKESKRNILKAIPVGLTLKEITHLFQKQTGLTICKTNSICSSNILIFRGKHKVTAYFGNVEEFSGETLVVAFKNIEIFHKELKKETNKISFEFDVPEKQLIGNLCIYFKKKNFSNLKNLPEQFFIYEGPWKGIAKKTQKNEYHVEWKNIRTKEIVKDTLTIEKISFKDGIKIFRKKLNGYYTGTFFPKENVFRGKADWYKSINSYFEIYLRTKGKGKKCINLKKIIIENLQ